MGFLRRLASPPAAGPRAADRLSDDGGRKRLHPHPQRDSGALRRLPGRHRARALWAVIAVATAANVVGSGIAYAVGRYGGRPLFLKYGRYVLIQKHHLDKADRWFERRGELTVFFTRMMPGVRTFISLPAGIAKMPVVKFFVYSLLGLDTLERRAGVSGLRGRQGGRRRRGQLGQAAGAVQPLRPHLLHRAGRGGGWR